LTRLRSRIVEYDVKRMRMIFANVQSKVLRQL
jgi:hypothetical protein